MPRFTRASAKTAFHSSSEGERLSIDCVMATTCVSRFFSVVRFRLRSVLGAGPGATKSGFAAACRLGNFVFNASGLYSTFHAPPYRLVLVVDFSIDHGRITPAFRVYRILSDNTITNYQPRFVNDSEFDSVNDLLRTRSRRSAATSGDVKAGENNVATPPEPQGRIRRPGIPRQ